MKLSYLNNFYILDSISYFIDCIDSFMVGTIFFGNLNHLGEVTQCGGLSKRNLNSSAATVSVVLIFLLLRARGFDR